MLDSQKQARAKDTEIELVAPTISTKAATLDDRIDFLFFITLIEVSLGDRDLHQQDNASRLIL